MKHKSFKHNHLQMYEIKKISKAQKKDKEGTQSFGKIKLCKTNNINKS